LHGSSQTLLGVYYVYFPNWKILPGIIAQAVSGNLWAEKYYSELLVVMLILTNGQGNTFAAMVKILFI